MSPEIISALIALIGIVIGVIPTYLYMRQKNTAEVDKLKAETDKLKAETQKIHSELPLNQTLTINHLLTQTGDIKKDIVSRENLEEFRKHLENFRELLLVGINLRRLTVSYHSTLIKRMNEGATLKVILVKPDGIALPFLAKRSIVHSTPDSMAQAINMTLHNLANIYSKVPHAKIEVRVLDYIPSCSMLIINPKGPDGLIRVDIYPYKVSPEENPGFFVRENVNSEWHSFFIEQFENLWSTAQKIEIQEWNDER